MKTKVLAFLFTLSLILIFAGSFMGRYYHTSKGKVDVKEISFITPEGGMLRSLLYIPKDIKPGEKRPAVVGAHGYNNTAELQGLNAIELSSRGIVVLTVDQYGHGKSGFPSEAVNNGISADGGIYEAMQYLKNLPFVDLNKVGLVGHSMGGTNIQAATEKAMLNHRYLQFKPQVTPEPAATVQPETNNEDVIIETSVAPIPPTKKDTGTIPATPITKPATKANLMDSGELEDKIKAEAEVVQSKVDKIEDKVNAEAEVVQSKVDKAEDKIKAEAEVVQSKVDKIEDKVETEAEVVQSKVDKIEDKVNAEAEVVQSKVDKIEDKVNAETEVVQSKVDKIEDKIEEIIEEEEEEEEIVLFNRYIDRDQIVVPVAILPTSQSFTIANVTPVSQRRAGYNDLLKLYDEYAINIGVVFGQFDEWAKPMWGVEKGSLINTTEKANALMGFTLPEYGKLYRYGSKLELSKNDAIQAAQDGRLRVIYQPKTVHPRIHMSKVAATNITEFFHLTLLNGADVKDYNSQLWFKKEISTGVALAGYFLFIMTAGLVLLRTRFFSSIVRDEPISPSNPSKFSQYKVYILIYLGCLIPAPLFYNLVTGYPIDIKSAGRTVKTLFPANDIFPMPTANGLVLFNLIIGTIMLVVFILTYKRYMKKNGVTFGDLGVALNVVDIVKAFILAALVFISGYVLLAMVEFLFQVDFRFYVFSIKTLTTPKLCMFAAYLPFWLFMFLINSLTLNSFTRMEGRPEVVNILLMMFANVGGLLILWALDYGFLIKTGVKMFETVPYPLGTTSALAGVLLWGLLFILPISAVISRIYFKATGSIWLGGFLNAMVITLFAISNTVVAAGIL